MAQSPQPGKKMAMIVSIVAGALLVVLGVPIMYGISAHNGAVKQEASIDEAASNIDVVVQKRVDSLSQMINAVRESSEFEKETIAELTEARSQAQEGQVEESNMTIAAVAEAYPELKTVDLYQDVSRESATVENQIRGSREVYNKNVTDYRRYTKTFPRSFALSLQSYDVQEYDLFEASENAENFDPSTDNLWDE